MAAQTRYVVYSPNVKDFAAIVGSSFPVLIPGAYVVEGEAELDAITILARGANAEAYALELANHVITQL